MDDGKDQCSLVSPTKTIASRFDAFAAVDRSIRDER